MIIMDAFWIMIFDFIDCYSLDRTLEIHGAAKTKQIQEQHTVASNWANPLNDDAYHSI